MTEIETRPASQTGAETPVAPGSIVVQDLAKQYGRRAAVDGLTLSVESGEFLALLGPSGCGKSTTLRMLAGLEAPDRGAISISGRDVTRVPAHRRNVHTVFQSYALFPHLTVADNVAFPLRQQGVERSEVDRRVAEALAAVQLGDAGPKSVSNLSGGQQQRVALARAVVDRPAVLLLDEPMSALDRALRQAMQIEIRLIQQELGVTTILVSHDQEEALSLADRIAIMSNGRLEQVGSAEDVYDRPANRFVAGFVGEQNEISGRCDSRGILRHPKLSVAAVDSRTIGPAVALVRPEHVNIDTQSTCAAPDTVNSVCGIVRGVSIAGICTVVLVHADGLNLIARVPRDGRPVPKVADCVRCWWHPSQVSIFVEPGSPED
ncbi:ABC transporter ATP-binding protein [Mycobacterium sp. 852013-50091_SCH5140682]|uniref:ABC transporter ATP-binding protein n=1 Tax=Mycobacterium sp. 852013-50091_SCH5140682 TaxID=1834109 RepID=UPI000B2C86B1|nr:ABC transporter ATP-binding protein [Mycobacterium sp. 852013-50091_SCH5140682]